MWNLRIWTPSSCLHSKHSYPPRHPPQPAYHSFFLIFYLTLKIWRKYPDLSVFIIKYTRYISIADIKCPSKKHVREEKFILAYKSKEDIAYRGGLRHDSRIMRLASQSGGAITIFRLQTKRKKENRRWVKARRSPTWTSLHSLSARFHFLKFFFLQSFQAFLPGEWLSFKSHQ